MVNFLALAPKPLWAINDTIIAVVNDDVITLQDLHDYLQAMYMQLISEGKSKSQIEKTMANYEANGLNRLIEDKLLVNEANQKGMTIRPKAIDDRINEIKRRYPTEEEFMDAIISQGMTYTDLRNKITDQIKAKYVVEFEVKKKIFVNPQEVTEYYQKNLNNFVKPESVDLDSIFIPIGDDKALATEKSGEAFNQLWEGADFSEIAKKYSKAPSVGIIEKGQLLPKLEEIVFNLKKGEISKPIEIDEGIYIFKLKEKYPAETVALENVRNEIYNLIFQEKFQDRLKSWLEKLRKKAYVEIKD